MTWSTVVLGGGLRSPNVLLVPYSVYLLCDLLLCLLVSVAMWKIIDDMATWGLIVKWINLSYMNSPH